MKKNILVFPCGSEIALEIYRSLKHSTHFNLIGANSVDDHGKFVFSSYIENIPFITDPDFIPTIKEVVQDYTIDAIYPATDAVITLLKRQEKYINCKVISSTLETVEICLSKRKTYEKLKNAVRVPQLFKETENLSYPVFGKPDNGYGSRGVKKIESKNMLDEYIAITPTALLCEYLSGEEYTVDCFTDRHGCLLFHAPRLRKRIMNGISVNTIPYYENDNEITKIVQKINSVIQFRGAWFVQLKRNDKGELVLLEIAARLGGSSSLFRGKGVNFAQLTLFDAFDKDVTIQTNDYNLELDRALDNIFRIDIKYTEVFCDFDDCMIIEGKYVNSELIAFLYQCFNHKIKLTLLTRHSKNIQQSLNTFRLDTIFDRIIHLPENEKKSDYIDNINAIFIDDSFTERQDVYNNKKIPVFGLDMISNLHPFSL
ncbi:carbamoylphosphate synthase large subunit short form [Spirochaetia bacterium]|nr:carbamoylphosphate synthase large subunit short form [Spirochaetia bacterium]